jgi:TRAP-type C4-dicarboxylate transport system substrate-binding protein
MRRSALFLALSVGLCLTAPQGARAAKVQWPLAILWPPGNFSTQGAVAFAELVKERTGGELEIVVHAGGALGFKGPEMLKVIKDGLAPVGEMLLGFVAGTEPLMDFSTMPFLVADEAQAARLGQIARPYTDKLFDKWNQRMLYWQFWPGAGLYSQKPVSSVADLKGLKIRTFNALSTDWVKAAGGNPVSMPWGDVYMAMSTGAIDAVLTSTTSGADGKFWEVMKHFTRLNFTFGYSAVTVNKDALAKLTEAQRKAVLETAAEMDEAQRRRSAESDRTATARIVEGGIRVSEMSSEFHKACAELARPIWKEWIAKAGPEAEKLIQEFQASR